MTQSYKFIAVRVQQQLHCTLSRNTLVIWFVATSSLSYDLSENPAVARVKKLCFALVWTLVTNMRMTGSVQHSKKGMGKGLRAVLLQSVQNAVPFYPKFNLN